MNFKYHLNQEVFYMFNNRIASGRIVGRKMLEVSAVDYDKFRHVKTLVDKIGPAGTTYILANGTSEVAERLLFASREDLIETL